MKHVHRPFGRAAPWVAACAGIGLLVASDAGAYQLRKHAFSGGAVATALLLAYWPLSA